ELAVGRDCGAPRAVVDEGDFTEVVTRTELAVLSAADRDRCLASLDHEEPRAGPALVGDRAARVEDALLERAREPLEVAALEVLEERDPLKELHRGFVSHVSILWLCGLGAARKLFDLALGRVEPLLAEAVELLTALPQLERLVERRLARLEPVDDLLELLLGLLEGHRVSSTRAPKPPSASSTSTRSPVSSPRAERTIASFARTIA